MKNKTKPNENWRTVSGEKKRGTFVILPIVKQGQGRNGAKAARRQLFKTPKETTVK